jgi:hypothetical protein
MEMSFTEESGRKVVLRGMTSNTTKVVTTKRMEAIFRREEIVYLVECKILACVDKKGKVHYAPEIQRIIDKHNKVFGPIPPGVPQTGDLSISLSWRKGQIQSSPCLTDTQRSTRTK